MAVVPPGLRNNLRKRLALFFSRQPWQQHLTSRLTIYFLLLSLLLVSITSSVTFYQAKDSLQQSAFSRLAISSELKQQEINRWFEDQQRIFLAIAQLPIVQTQSQSLLQAETVATDRRTGRANLLQYFRSLETQRGSLMQISVMDTSDHIILSTDNALENSYESSADLTYFDEIKPGKPTNPIFYQSPTENRLMTTFATPLRNSEGKRIGVLMARLNLDRLSQIVHAQSDSQQMIDAYLIANVEGKNTLISKTLEQTQIGQTLKSSGIESAMRGEPGRGLYPNYAQIPVIGVYQSLSDLGLGLMVEQRQSIANLPAQHLAQQIVGLGVILTVILALGMYYLVRQIAHPILAIAHTAKQVSMGDLDRHAPVLTQDEVGLLARNFNEMVTQLKRSQMESERHNQSLTRKAEELQQALQELSSAQSQLVQSEKMSALGQLVAGVAHEINNPVNYIHGNLKYLEDYTQELTKLVRFYRNTIPSTESILPDMTDEANVDFILEDVIKVVNSMKSGTDRIREIVLSLRNFSRLDESALQSVDIHEGIDSTLMILQHRLKLNPPHPDIQIVKQYGDLPKIECYPGQLNQVFMNLLANAIDVLEELEINSTEPNRISRPPTISIQTELIQSGWIRITIADNGIGIPESVKSHLFDPFFTTKPIGKGTGLGLSISYKIVVERHHGRLYCESQIGMGTQFCLEIPIQSI